MYSMLDLLFDTPAYSPLYVTSDSEMKELQRTQNQEELMELLIKRKGLEKLIKLNLNILMKEKKY